MIAYPADFVSDGCTGFFDTWRGIDLTACCTAHDYAWYSHPGDWLVWAGSNIELGSCFVAAGTWELFVPAVVAVSTVGAVLFARNRKR